MKCKKCNKEYDDSFKFCPHCGASAKVARRNVKRANGQGTIYKRSDIKSTPWEAVAPAQRVIKNGQIVIQRQIIGHYKTATEAREALEQFRLNPTTKLDITVEQVYTEWSKTKFRNVGEKQIEAYENSYKKLSKIYKTKMRDLRTGDMQRIIDDNLHLSVSALQKIKVLLGQLCQYSLKNDIINKNYAEFIELPKEIKTVKDCFTDLDIEKLKQTAGIVPYADLILIMCYTGHRIGEFLSLTRFNVVNDGEMMFLQGGNKTDAGKNKLVPVSPVIREYVDKWISKDGDTIFCNTQNKQFAVKYFREKIYYPTLEKVGLPKLPPHATRRTFSTRLAAAGVREDEIIKMMGHTDYSVDVQSYINPEQKTLYNAICKMS